MKSSIILAALESRQPSDLLIEAADNFAKLKSGAIIDPFRCVVVSKREIDKGLNAILNRNPVDLIESALINNTTRTKKR